MNTLLSALAFHKNLELQNEQENEADEYLDAFVALGGQSNKEGYVSKEILITIIKMEFELTIDMRSTSASQEVTPMRLPTISSAVCSMRVLVETPAASVPLCHRTRAPLSCVSATS